MVRLGAGPGVGSAPFAMRSDPPASLAPPRSRGERNVNFIGHSIVNGCAVMALAGMHVWGSLSPEMAAGGILAVCGVWGLNTRKGPPSGATGLAAVAGWLSTWR